MTYATLISPLAIAVLLSTFSSPVDGQTRQATPDDPLFQTLVSLDRALFEAYNTCDLETFGSLFAEDVEFYHDKGGLTRTRQALVESIRTNICGKTRRDLIPGSLEVHPMDGYGALQLGAHRFCDIKAERCDDRSGGVGRFIHLWRHTNGTWVITRVISYDHAAAR